MRKILLLFLIVLLFALPVVFGETYYVDATSGSDANNGTIDGSGTIHAWQTISQVNTNVTYAPGDRILFKRGETWTERLMPLSGNSTHYVTYSSYGSGALPIIDARSLINASNYMGNWTATGNNKWNLSIAYNAYEPLRVWFDDVEYEMADNYSIVSSSLKWAYSDSNKMLTVYSISNPASTYTTMKGLMKIKSAAMYFLNIVYVNVSGLDLRGGQLASLHIRNSSNIIVQDSNIGYYGRKGILSQAHFSDKSATSQNNTFRYLTLDSGYALANTYNGVGLEDGVQFSVGSYNHTIRNSTFTNWGHTAIYFKSTTSGYSDGSSYHKAYGNVVSYTNIVYAHCFGIDGLEGNSTYNQIYENRCSGSTVPIEINGNNNYFYNNIISSVGTTTRPGHSATTGVALWSSDYCSGCVSHNNSIYHNTFYNMNALAFYMDDPETGNHTIRDNIFYNFGLSSTTYGDLAIDVADEATIINMDFRNNLFYKNTNNLSVFSYRNRTLNLEGFEIYTGANGDTISGNLWGNPLFSGFTPYADSPACGAATDGDDIGALSCLSVVKYAAVTNKNPVVEKVSQGWSSSVSTFILLFVGVLALFIVGMFFMFRSSSSQGFEYSMGVVQNFPGILIAVLVLSIFAVLFGLIIFTLGI